MTTQERLRKADGAPPAGTMLWHRSHRADPRACRIADRHYNRQKPGTPQFVPPGRCLVLLTEGADALWVSSWPFAEYVKHAWAGAWICSGFRNESSLLSSMLISQAVAATRYYWGDAPKQGMVTFVDPMKVRRKRDMGRCYRRAGWRVLGQTAGGLVALGLAPEAMPAPEPAGGITLRLFGAVGTGPGAADPQRPSAGRRSTQPGTQDREQDTQRDDQGGSGR